MVAIVMLSEGLPRVCAISGALAAFLVLHGLFRPYRVDANNIEHVLSVLCSLVIIGCGLGFYFGSSNLVQKCLVVLVLAAFAVVVIVTGVTTYRVYVKFRAAYNKGAQPGDAGEEKQLESQLADSRDTVVLLARLWFPDGDDVDTTSRRCCRFVGCVRCMCEFCVRDRRCLCPCRCFYSTAREERDRAHSSIARPLSPSLYQLPEVSLGFARKKWLVLDMAVGASIGLLAAVFLIPNLRLDSVTLACTEIPMALFAVANVVCLTTFVSLSKSFQRAANVHRDVRLFLIALRRLSLFWSVLQSRLRFKS